MARRSSLLVEVGLNLALLTTLVSLLDAAVLVLATRYTLENATTEVAESAARVLAAELAGASESDYRRVLDEYRRAGLRDVTVFSPSGQILAGERVPAGPGAQAAFASREVVSDRVQEDGENRIRVAAPVGVGRPEAVVQLRMGMTRSAAPDWSTIVGHAAFSGAIVVLFGLLLFRRSLLQPIARMREATRRIADGDFGVTVPDDAPSELADMAAALNTMSGALRQYRERTEEQVERLEAANRQLQAAQEALLRSARLASVGRLAAGLAHELGNPLAAVRGYLELLQGGGMPEPLSADLTGRARVEVERMHALIRNLLDFARNDQREVGDVRLAELLDEAARTVRHQAAFRDIDLRVEVEGEPVVRGEAAKLHQVLVNLLLNAADAGAKRIVLRAADTEVVCTDDGEGIAPESRDRLFEPFFTTRAPGKGTGLGLAICHRVMEQHGGRIEADGAPGEGATFRLKFPSPG
jgi:signal transduction histidine kinase